MPWYCCRTVPRREIDAAAEINQAGIGSYLPIRWELHKPSRHAKRKVATAVAMFPGYCFALARDAEHLLAVLAAQKWVSEARGQVPATGKPISINGRPVPVSESAIGILREWEASGEANERPPPVLIISVGQTVVIASGPFEGREGRVLTVGKCDEEGRPRSASISIGGVPVKCSTSVLRVAA